MSLQEELAQRLMDYAENTQKKRGKNRIIACKKQQQASARFLEDVSKIPDEKYPYYFDLEEVERFYLWSRMFEHTKGILANQKIELNDFQLFLVANLFGWKKKATGHRRFRKSYIQVARKNSKSQLLALITSYECFLSGEQAECYIAGVNREQSGIVFNEIVSQLARVTLLKPKYKHAYGKIMHKKSQSIIQPLSKEAKKSGDGKNPSFCVIDEYHAHKTSEIYDVLNSGMAARPNGHICIITTAGLSVNENPCFKEYQYVSQILDPNNAIENDEYFVFILELDESDNPKDPKNWIKCNPVVCSYEEGINFIKGELKAALDAPEKMTAFLTKNMNMWVRKSMSGFIPLDRWKKCEMEFNLQDFRGYDTLVGVDLSATTDLTSVSFLFFKEGTTYVHSHSFIPSETLEKKRKTDKVPYDQWVREGHITETVGAIVSYKTVEEYIQQIEELYDLNIKEICFDKYNAPNMMENFDEKGYTVVEIPQRIAALTIPTKSFRERVYDQKIAHNANPTLTWAIGNAIAKTDAQQNAMLDKSRSTERIDPVAATINAFARIAVLEQNLKNLEEHVLSEDFSF
jgi:phage terminase large subunit-like protein